MRALKLFCLFLLCLLANSARSATLDFYWIDAEGGTATLIVTPAGESILIDTGWPTRFSWQPTAPRIHKVASQVAGVRKIDYLVTTHFDIDHFPAAPEVAKLIPIGTVLDNGAPDKAPDDGYRVNFDADIKAYREFKAEHRRVIQVGETIALKQASGTPKLTLRCLAARQQFVPPPAGAKTSALCAEAKRKAPDLSENANSIVLLLEFGEFRFFHSGDLTWNLESKLVCPHDLVGKVDLFEVAHHGESLSNNPLLIGALAPTVAVMNNGTHKGGDPATFATLRHSGSVIYQLHKNMSGGKERNTEDRLIANPEEKCSGNYIKCSVDSSSRKYTISIPGTGYERVFRSGRK